MTSTSRLWGNWLIYGLSSMAGRLVGFLMLPIYTRVLSPEEYGIRAMVTVGVDLVGMVCSLGLITAMVRYYTGESGQERRPEAVSTAYLTTIAVLGAGVALGCLAAPWLARLVLGDAVYAPYLRLGLIALFFTNTMDIGFAYLRLRQRAGMVALLAMVILAATLTANIALVVVLRWGVLGILYGEIATYAVMSTVLAVLTVREVGVRFVPDLARRMIRYGAPLTMMPFAWLLVSRADGVFLTHYGSLAAAGVYSLALQCAQVLLITVINPFRDVWDPGQFEVARDPEGGRVYARMFRTFSVTIVLAAFVFALGAEDVIRVLAAPAFHDAAAVVPILLAAHVVTGISLFFNSALLVKNRTVWLGGIALVTGVVNIAANAVLVPRFFAAGAASSRLLALLVMAAITWAVAQRLWPQRVPFGAPLKMVALALGALAVGELIPDTSFALSVLLKGALTVALVAVSVWVGVLDREEIEGARRLLRRGLRAAGLTRPRPA